MSGKQWKVHAVDEKTAELVAAQVGVGLPIARVLVSRNLHTAGVLDEFLNPKLASLADPFELPEMGKAVDGIWEAIDADKRIVVFGDYDVDGITSSALLTRALRELGADVKPFIPDRLEEGYGLSLDAMKRCLGEHKPGLVITVDCGTNSSESIAYAQSKHVDVIVTDHHEPEGELPVAYALINPKVSDNEKNKTLCGAGIAFKLAYALVKQGRSSAKPTAAAMDLRDYLDLAALGTVADIVPLIGENRIFVRHGLRQMGQSRWEGLEALKRVAKITGEPDTYHLGFQIGPRINAAGRIGESMNALELLLTDDKKVAEETAGLLDAYNLERRHMERTMAEEAFAEIDTYFDPAIHYGLVVARAGWHPGVVGIVASRVARHYNRPAIVMGMDETGIARGSCRSIDGYNMLDGLQVCEAHLNTFGGHQMAAGLEVKDGALEQFKTEFNSAVASTLAELDLQPVQYIDSVVNPKELDWDFYNQLKNLRPFGQANREPVWLLENIQVAGAPRVVGQKHLKLIFQAAGKRLEAIAFNFAIEDLPEGSVDVAFVLKENSWQGNVSLQLQVEAIRSTACGKS